LFAFCLQPAYVSLSHKLHGGRLAVQVANTPELSSDFGLFAGETTGVEFFFIDTNPFVESYWVENNKDYTWQLPISREDYIAHELMVSC
jgi:hypothetical protein